MNAVYGGIAQPRQQHVASFVKGIEWGLGMRGLRMAAAFWMAASRSLFSLDCRGYTGVWRTPTP